MVDVVAANGFSKSLLVGVIDLRGEVVFGMKNTSPVYFICAIAAIVVGF